MIKSLTIGLLFISIAAYGQFSPVKRALENLDEGDPIKAHSLLTRAIERDSLDPGVVYAFSRLYDDSSYNGVNADSAYYYILRARELYTSLDFKSIERLVKTGVDSLVLEEQKLLLDSQAFSLAVSENTVRAYNEFQSKYPTSSQFEESIIAEHRKAFSNARKSDNYNSYQSFMSQYPEAKEFNKALELYETRLFEAKTSSGKLQDLKEFLIIRPGSPFRDKVENEIFEIITAGNRIIDFKAFFDLAITDRTRKRASEYLYHILRDAGQIENMHETWWTDSLSKVNHKPGRLYPMISKDGYFFFDEKGKELSSKSPQIESLYLCDGNDTDIIIGKNTVSLMITDRLGHEIFNGSASEARDLGFGLIAVFKDEKSAVFHKNGEQITPFIYQDVSVINGSFIATIRDGYWGLLSFTGKTILPNQYDTIEGLSGNIIITRNNKSAVSSTETLKAGADGEVSSLVFLYDEYEVWEGNKLWVRSGDSEALINEASGYDIELESQEIIPEYDRFVIFGENNRILDSNFSEVETGWNEYSSSDSFIWLIKKGQEYLSEAHDYQLMPYDSVELWGMNFAKVKSSGTWTLVFSQGERIPLESGQNLKLFSNDKLEYIGIVTESNTTLYDRNGNPLFNGEVINAKVLGEEYLVIEGPKGQGLYSTKGVKLLPHEFDAFGGYFEGGVSVLKKGKLGYFHLRDSIWLKPEYSRKVKDTRAGYFAIYEDNGFRIIDKDGKYIGERSFEEIDLWNDSTLVVSKEGHYSIYNPSSDKVLIGDLKEFNATAYPEWGVYIKSPTGFGIMHPENGMIIPPEYTFLEEIGNLIRAEKYVRAANYYVIAYYNKAGEIIYRTGLSPEEYDKVLCEN